MIRIITFLAITWFSKNGFGQTEYIIKETEYNKYYTPFFSQVPVVANKSIKLYQTGLYTYLGMTRNENDMQPILQYLNDSCHIDKSRFYELYNSWILNIPIDRQNTYRRGITKAKKNKLIKKSENIILTVLPPFKITKSIILLQFYLHCEGLCSSHNVYLIKWLEEEQKIEILIGGAIAMQ